jgi:hypothetical protein
MGGGVAAEVAATYFPQYPCVNLRSFSSLSDVSVCVLGAMLGLPDRPLVRRLVR